MTAFRQIFQNSGRVNSFTAADFEGDRRYVRLRPLAPTNDPNGARIRAAQVAEFEQQLRDLGLAPQQPDETDRRELNNNPTEAASAPVASTYANPQGAPPFIEPAPSLQKSYYLCSSTPVRSINS